MFLYLVDTSNVINLQDLATTFYADARTQRDRNPELSTWFAAMGARHSHEARIRMGLLGVTLQSLDSSRDVSW